MTALLFVLAAGIGAVGRHVVGCLVCSWQALLLVNTAGSALLGFLIGVEPSTGTLTVLGVGFCGALTTFSSFTIEARSLGWRWGAGYAVLSVTCACAAAALGASLA